MINDRIVIVCIENRYILACIKDDNLEEIYAYSDICRTIKPGTIVNARVTKTNEELNSCFIRTGKDDHGYLDKAYKCESVLPVLYKKEPSGNKKALYTDELSIAGKYCVIYENEVFVRASSKLSKNNKQLLKDKYSAIADELQMGILLRSSVITENPSDSDVTNEIISIAKTLKDIRHKSATRPEYTVFYSTKPQIIEDILSYVKNKDLVEIVTDNKDVYELINDYQLVIKNESSQVELRFYEDKLLPLSKLYAFENKISKVTSRVYNLKNGADIFFDCTEALTAIDVNSSSFKKKVANKDDYVLALNKEAFLEIYKQIRLRNYSGIIIIDFINMIDKNAYIELESYINEMIKSDRISFKFHGFTVLGLAEFSRQKVRNSFWEQLR